MTRNDLDLVLRLVPEEYLRLAFGRRPEAAAQGVRRSSPDRPTASPGPENWLNIADYCLSTGRLDLARDVLDRASAAVQLLAAFAAAARRRRPVAEPDRSGSSGRKRRPSRLPRRTAPSLRPGRLQASRLARDVADLDDPLETLAVFGHLLRFGGVEFTGDPGLVDAAEQLRSDVPVEVRRRSEKRSVASTRSTATSADSRGSRTVPGRSSRDGSCISSADGGVGLPAQPESAATVHLVQHQSDGLAAPGCRLPARTRAHRVPNWEAVFLLHAAGVPAFFSGSIATTVDTVVPRAGGAHGGHDRGRRGRRRSGRATHPAPRRAVRRRELGENLVAAAEDLRSYRDAGARIVTSRLRFFLAARAVGCPASSAPASWASTYVPTTPA